MMCALWKSAAPPYRRRLSARLTPRAASAYGPAGVGRGTSMPELLARLFGTPEASAAFGDRARLQGMLDFEAALARAEARIGVIPAAAAESIARRCRAESFDLAALADGTAKAGNPAIPMVAALTARVAADDAEAARYVHWGATSQDAMDTGLVLQLRQLAAVLEDDLDRLSASLAGRAEEH